MRVRASNCDCVQSRWPRTVSALGQSSARFCLFLCFCRTLTGGSSVLEAAEAKDD